MGGKGSKPEPIVIYNEPDVPIQFTPNLLRALDGTAPPPPTFASPFSPPASNTPANSNIDDVVKQRVQREVELHQQKRLVHEQRSADQVRREVEDLLRRQKIPPKQEAVPEYVEKQDAVIACYNNKPGRTLDCWREVEEFKEVAKKAQREFVAAH